MITTVFISKSDGARQSGDAPRIRELEAARPS
jgi:hypothetical protein